MKVDSLGAVGAELDRVNARIDDLTPERLEDLEERVAKLEGNQAIDELAGTAERVAGLEERIQQLEATAVVSGKESAESGE